MSFDARLDALLDEGLALHRRSRLTEARQRYEQVLRTWPTHARTWHLLGVLELQSQQPGKAVLVLTNALIHNPGNAAAHHDLGGAFMQLQRYAEAAAAFERALQLNPQSAEFHAGHGNALFELRRFESAVRSYEAAQRLDPGFIGGHFNRALCLFELRRFEEAIAGFDATLRRDSKHARAWNYRGAALFDLGRFEQAIENFQQALALQPGYAEALNNLGNAQLEVDAPAAALQSFRQALSLQPRWADAHNNLGNALLRLDQSEAALAAYDAALALAPDYAGVHFNRGQTLLHLQRQPQAVSCLERALTLNPDVPYARGARLLAKMQICDWHTLGAEISELEAAAAADKASATPFEMLALSGSAALQKQVAEIWIKRHVGSGLPRPPAYEPSGKLRIGYFSADFHDHPVSRLSAAMYELHDRNRFEITAFSFGPDTQDAMRQRLKRAFDRFLDLRERSAAEIADLARQMRIDIAVDLTGLTKRCRPRIFAMRAAPLQASYLGYLGTMAAPFMDYLLSDANLIPPDLRRHYSESLLYLPSYQANDSERMPANDSMTRPQLGLPPQAFVFCCFNSNYKFTPTVFDVWMRILRRVPGSVLFLYAESSASEEALRREAHDRGIDAERLVFGGSLAESEYLSRYRCADLFLDTLPYNAGTTASDALWAGLPMLTCPGETFSSRMATSILKALDVTETIAADLRDYEETAVALATDSGRYAALKRKVAENRAKMLLFDAHRHIRHMEQAFEKMQARHSMGLAPADIVVESG